MADLEGTDFIEGGEESDKRQENTFLGSALERESQILCWF